MTASGDGSTTAPLVALSTRAHGESFSFGSLKEVLGRANEPRSGDKQAGLAPRSMREMAAAKDILLSHPLICASDEAKHVAKERHSSEQFVELGDEHERFGLPHFR